MTDDENISGESLDNSIFRTRLSTLTASQDQDPDEHYVEIPYDTEDEAYIIHDSDDYTVDDTYSPTEDMSPTKTQSTHKVATSSSRRERKVRWTPSTDKHLTEYTESFSTVSRHRSSTHSKS